jgi:hypothetical protein
MKIKVTDLIVILMNRLPNPELKEFWEEYRIPTFEADDLLVKSHAIYPKEETVVVEHLCFRIEPYKGKKHWFFVGVR